MVSKENSVMIGLKDVMTYAYAVKTQAEVSDSLTILARGKAISKAVDVSQVTINRIIDGWEVTDIRIGTEVRDRTERDSEKAVGTSNVSYIEIDLAKK